jgi:hypothetical protein
MKGPAAAQPISGTVDVHRVCLLMGQLRLISIVYQQTGIAGGFIRLLEWLLINFLCLIVW